MAQPVDEVPPHILLFVPHPDFLERLADTLTGEAFSVTATSDQAAFANAVRNGGFSAIVTATPFIGSVRATAAVPIINYEIFIHRRALESDAQSVNRSYFDVDDFIKRIRFHIRATAMPL
jgi:hypothetical protein